MFTIKRQPDTPLVAIIGGGAAGMMAAISAAEYGADVVLFEKNDRMGKKLRITGKGRCNVTNDCDLNTFLNNVPTNPRFLYSAFNAFSTQDVKDFFEALGVPLKTERGNRVFPVSDHAGDIVAALEKKCRISGVQILHEKVVGISLKEGKVAGIKTLNGELEVNAAILCTGGKSYPTTGSDGDGYRFAVACGHTVTKIEPSLIPLTTSGNFCQRLQGLSLRNIALRIVEQKSGKIVYDDFGELLFTHFGISGPTVLSASSHLTDITPGKYVAEIDLKPALDLKTLNHRLLSDFEKYKNKDFANALCDLLPSKMIEPMVELSGIDPQKKVNSVTKEEREQLCRLLKSVKISITGTRPISEAIITRGGVNIKEIQPSTMESKLVNNLFFAGELIDVDAYTGGFNLQIAFSTGRLAGINAAGTILDERKSYETLSDCN